MKDRKIVKNIHVYLICLLQVIFMFLVYIVNKRLEIYSDISYISMSLIFMGMLVMYLAKKYNYGLILSVIFIINTLFIRSKIYVDKYFNFDIYLDYWFSHIDNEVVFYNILGNLFVFIPFTLFLSKVIKNIFKTLFIVLIIILVVEFLQAFLKLGIFDIVDIILNYIGVIIVLVGAYLYEK